MESLSSWTLKGKSNESVSSAVICDESKHFFFGVCECHLTEDNYRFDVVQIYVIELI